MKRYMFGVVGGLFFVAHAAEPNAVLLQRLMNDPVSVLHETCHQNAMVHATIRAGALPFQHVMQSLSEDTTPEQEEAFGQAIMAEQVRVHDIINFAEQRAPLCLLGECDVDDCPLNRTHMPWRRAAYAQRLAGLLVQQADRVPNQHAPITYTSFASGQLFTDLCAVATFLHQRPQARLNVHCIDRMYEPWVDVREVVQTIGNNPIACEVLPARTSPGFWKGIEEDWDQEIWAALYIDRQLHQWVTFLDHLFPNAVRLFAHDDVDTYMDFIRKYTLPSADVVSAIDMPWGASEDIGAEPRHDYFRLVINTLQAKPHSTNVWCDTVSFDLASTADPRAVAGTPDNLLVDDAATAGPTAWLGAITLERPVQPCIQLNYGFNTDNPLPLYVVRENIQDPVA